MSSAARITRQLTRMDLQSLNKILREIQLDVSAIQGRGGPTTIEDDLVVDGSLGIGDALIKGDLTATLDGISDRPLAPWIPGSMSLSDNVTVPMIQITQGQHFSTGGLIYYQISSTVSAAVLTETGLVVYSGARSAASPASSVSSVALSQADTSGIFTLLTTFTTTNQTETYRIEINANTSVAPATLDISYVVWPLNGAVQIL